MNACVVDASVAVKWFFAEPGLAEAERVLAGPLPLHAPELLHLEICSAAWKRFGKGEITLDYAREVPLRLARCPIRYYRCSNLAAKALAIACRTGRTVYDCTYLALALALRTKLITADSRLVNALADTPFGKIVLPLTSFGPGRSPQ